MYSTWVVRHLNGIDTNDTRHNAFLQKKVLIGRLRLGWWKSNWYFASPWMPADASSVSFAQNSYWTRVIAETWTPTGDQKLFLWILESVCVSETPESPQAKVEPYLPWCCTWLMEPGWTNRSLPCIGRQRCLLRHFSTSWHASLHHTLQLREHMHIYFFTNISVWLAWRLPFITEYSLVIWY